MPLNTDQMIVDGWSADLQRGKTDFQRNCVLEGENVCRMWESQYTSCFNDGFGNCGGYTCDLCDFDDCPR